MEIGGKTRMFDALTYQIMLEEIKENTRKYGILDDTIGILVTRPDLPTGNDILNSLEYFHFRTGKSVNFYLPGYGAYWPKDIPLSSYASQFMEKIIMLHHIRFKEEL